MKPTLKATLVPDYDGDTCLACHQSGHKIATTYDHGGHTLSDAYCGACGVNWGVKTERVWKDSRPIAPRLIGPPAKSGFGKAIPQSLDSTLRDSFGIKGRKKLRPYAEVADELGQDY